MFSPAIWEQIKAPLTEGSTGGAFSGDSVMGGDTLTSKVTMTNVNVNAIAYLVDSIPTSSRINHRLLNGH